MAAVQDVKLGAPDARGNRELLFKFDAPLIINGRETNGIAFMVSEAFAEKLRKELSKTRNGKPAGLWLPRRG